MSSLLEAPVQHTAAAGLCTTCEHAPRCTHPRAWGVPVLECDDMSPLVIAIAPTTGIEPVHAAKPPARHEAKGLCATCDRFVNCTYPKLEGGVWHCDEFETEAVR
jgi:hypothetical protein